jgi:hypothetical protein
MGFKSILFICSIALLVSCNPIKEMKDSIVETGHIRFPNPMEDAKTGTLVGGSPDELLMVAPHDACFPDDVPGLRKQDNTNVASKYQSYSFSGGAKAGLLDLLGTGNAAIGAGLDYHYASEVRLEMEGVKIEYFDSIMLAKYFRGQLTNKHGVPYIMPEECKEYLQYTGFIIQALRVEKLKFTFMNSQGVKMHINPKNIGVFLDIGLNASYHVENHTSLIIDTPKYIGYVLGRFRPEEDGIVLYRASKVKYGKFDFKSIDVFNGSNMYMSNRSITLDIYDEDGYFDDEITLDEDLIDSSSRFR